MLKLVFAAVIAILAMASPLWATDPPVDHAYDLIEQENWDEAARAATAALTRATTDIARFDAREALATIAYYTDDSDATLPELRSLDAEAIRLFGRDHPRRVPVLQLLGLTYDYLGDPEKAARALTGLIRIARLDGEDTDPLHHVLRDLAALYLDADAPQIAAILAADLALSAAEAYLDEIFRVAQGVNGLSAGRALSRAAARWSATPAFAASLRQLQDLEAGISALRIEFRSRLATGADAVDLQARLDADVSASEALRRGVALKFPDYARFATGQAIELAALAAKLHPDEVMVLTATSPDDASTGETGSVILAVTN